MLDCDFGFLEHECLGLVPFADDLWLLGGFDGYRYFFLFWLLLFLLIFFFKLLNSACQLFNHIVMFLFFVFLQRLNFLSFRLGLDRLVPSVEHSIVHQKCFLWSSGLCLLFIRLKRAVYLEVSSVDLVDEALVFPLAQYNEFVDQLSDQQDQVVLVLFVVEPVVVLVLDVNQKFL